MQSLSAESWDLICLLVTSKMLLESKEFLSAREHPPLSGNFLPFWTPVTAVGAPVDTQVG